jgi:hypothetical protein
MSYRCGVFDRSREMKVHTEVVDNFVSKYCLNSPETTPAVACDKTMKI